MKINSKKSLGQNWLINPHIIDKIVTAAEISKDDIILEVGPGTGNLTKKLAEKAGRVIAIEKDHRLIETLKETLKNYPNVEIVEEDVLKFNPTDYPSLINGYKIVANIPYYITSYLLSKIFEEWFRLPVEDPRFARGESEPQPKLIVLTIQKEVAQRIMAKPPHMNLLALSIQYYSEPEIIGYISKNNFRPVPKIDSAIIKLVPRDQWLVASEQEKLFNLMRLGFSEKRKQLAGVLSKKLKLKKEDILEAFGKTSLKSDIRPENLTLEQWIELEKHLST